MYDEETGIYAVGNALIHLTMNEMKLFNLLLRHKGEVLTYNQLYRYLFRKKLVNKNNIQIIAQRIGRLKEKLDIDKENIVIRTYYGKGYMLEK